MKIKDLNKKHAGAVSALIEELRKAGKSYRDIAGEIGNQFNYSYSYGTVAKFWKNDCGGVDIEQDHTPNLALKPSFDMEILSGLIEKSKGDEIGQIRAYILTLCQSNIKAHIAGKERLKVEYVKYLRDIETISKG